MTRSYTWTHAAIGQTKSSGKFDDSVLLNRPAIDPVLERVVKYIKAYNPTLNLPLMDPTLGPDATINDVLTSTASHFTSNGNIDYGKAVWPVLLTMFRAHRGASYIPDDQEFFSMISYVYSNGYLRCMTLYRRVIREYMGPVLSLADIYINNISIQSETPANARVSSENKIGAVISNVRSQSVLKFRTNLVGSINVIPFGQAGVMLPSTMTVTQALLHYFMVLPKDASIIIDYANVPGIPMTRIKNSMTASYVVDRFPGYGRTVKLSIDRVQSAIWAHSDGTVECELVVSNANLAKLPFSTTTEYPFACYHPGLMLSFILPGALDVPVEFSSGNIQ